MARAHAVIRVGIWADDDFLTLSAAAQRLYLLLLSQPQLTHCGVLPVTPKKWARLAPDTPPDAIHDALNELDAARFVVIDPDTDELLVRTLIRFDRTERQPNVRKAAQREYLLAITSSRIKRVLSHLYPQLFGAKALKAVGFSKRNPASQAGSREGVGEGVDEPPAEPAAKPPAKPPGEGATEPLSHARDAQPPASYLQPASSSEEGSLLQDPTSLAGLAATESTIEPDPILRLLRSLPDADKGTEAVLRRAAKGLPEAAIAATLEEVQTHHGGAGLAVTILKRIRTEGSIATRPADDSANLTDPEPTPAQKRAALLKGLTTWVVCPEALAYPEEAIRDELERRARRADTTLTPAEEHDLLTAWEAARPAATVEKQKPEAA